MPLSPDTPIDIRRLPALRAVLWDRRDTVLAAEELLHLYEDRWHYIDADAMDADEAALLRRLVAELGGGVFLGR